MTARAVQEEIGTGEMIEATGRFVSKHGRWPTGDTGRSGIDSPGEVFCLGTREGFRPGAGCAISPGLEPEDWEKGVADTGLLDDDGYRPGSGMVSIDRCGVPAVESPLFTVRAGGMAEETREKDAIAAAEGTEGIAAAGVTGASGLAVGRKESADAGLVDEGLNGCCDGGGLL